MWLLIFYITVNERLFFRLKYFYFIILFAFIIWKRWNQISTIFLNPIKWGNNSKTFFFLERSNLFFVELVLGYQTINFNLILNFTLCEKKYRKICKFELLNWLEFDLSKLQCILHCNCVDSEMCIKSAIGIAVQFPYDRKKYFRYECFEKLA